MKKAAKVLIAVGVIAVVVFGAYKTFSVLSPDGNDSVYTDWSKISTEEITDCGGYFKYYFNTLETDSEKRAYNTMLMAVEQGYTKISWPILDNGQIQNVYNAFIYDNPEYFYIDSFFVTASTFKTNLNLSYADEWTDENRLGQAKTVFENGIVWFEDKIPDDDYGAELYFHDYIVDNCTYFLDESEVADFAQSPSEEQQRRIKPFSNAFAALVDAKAGCEGYAKLMKVLLDSAEIENYLVSGNADNGETVAAHMWNVVKIDGEWYHLDCTWDDPLDSKVPDEITDGYRNYEFFNVTDEYISKTHSEFSVGTPCESLEANYYVKSGAYFDGKDPAATVDRLSEEAEKGSRFVSFRFSDTKAFDEAYKMLIGDGKTVGAAGRLLSKKKYGIKELYSTDSRESLLLTVIIIYETADKSAA